MRVWLALLVVGALFAGCTDDAPAAEPEATEPNQVDQAEAEPVLDPVLAGLEPPTWAVGHWWTYDTMGGRSTRIVTGETSDSWIIGTDNIATAYFDAKEPISNMGPQGKANLAGSQATGPIEFFQFPLTDGASWQTTWDGFQITITAADNGDGTWSFEGQNNGNVFVDYIYDPAVGWMRSVNFYNDDASIGYTMELANHGESYDGNVVDVAIELWVAENLTDAENGGDVPGAPPESTDLWLELEMVCTAPGAMSFVIGTSENTVGAVFPQNVSHGAAWHDGCPGTNVTSESIGKAPYPEDWGYHGAIASEGGRVKFEVYARTITETFWVGGKPS